MNFGSTYYQCLCCGEWVVGEVELCKECKLDVVDQNHESDLKQIQFWLKERKYDNILRSLEKAKHKPKTKWLYADMLFQQLKEKELQEFLASWGEEAVEISDIFNYYVFSMRVPYQVKEKKYSLNEIYENYKNELSKETLFFYYIFRIFQTFNPYVGSDLTQNYINQAEKMLQSIREEFSSNQLVEYVIRRRGGKEVRFPNKPPNPQVESSFFLTLEDIFRSLRNYQELYEIETQLIDVYAKGFYLIDAFSSCIRMMEFSSIHGSVEAFNQAVAKGEMLIALYQDEIIEYLPLFYNTYVSTTMRLGLYDKFKSFLDSEKFKSDVVLGRYHFLNHDFEKASEIFFNRSQKLLSEGNSIQYLLMLNQYSVSIILSGKKKMITNQLPITHSLNEEIMQVIKSIFSILALEARHDIKKAYELLNETNFESIQEVSSDLLLFEAKICLNFKMWKKKKKKKKKFLERNIELIEKYKGKLEILQQELDLIKITLIEIFANLLLNNNYNYDNKLKQISEVAGKLGQKNYQNFIKNISNVKKKDFTKKIEKNFELFTRAQGKFIWEGKLP